MITTAEATLMAAVLTALVSIYNAAAARRTEKLAVTTHELVNSKSSAAEAKIEALEGTIRMLLERNSQPAAAEPTKPPEPKETV